MSTRVQDSTGRAAHVREDDRAVELDAGVSDPVLSALAETESRYAAMRVAWDQQMEGLRAAQDELAQARQMEQQLADEVQRLREELQVERERVARSRTRARGLAEALKNVHRALFDGNVYTLILRACMTLTHSTRGLYLTC
jgi:chromosome segregation ATPase